MTSPACIRRPTAEYRHFISDSCRWGHFAPRAGDIFVCTPPKCGTTWVQTIVANLLFPAGDMPEPVTVMAPWLDARFNPLDETLARLAAQTHRRSIKTHTPADGIPWFADASYIVVGRDGRDAFMSFTNHIANLRPERIATLIASALEEGIDVGGGPPSADIHEFFAHWLADGQFFNFITTYWQYRDEPNVLFVHYDDLTADLDAEMRRIAGFLGIGVGETTWPEAKARCGFEYMRNNSEKIGTFDAQFVGGGKAFFFKGRNGRWRDVLTADELRAYVARATAALPPDARAWVDRAVV
ncbi:MAG TPA: sulfotransferase domain-containing protein [Candidatus Binatia bacterium]|jgi:aryl sulfotransferase|nr:sulfotransferase domain-containing protein [Candidatus Binatia bacterium]